MQQRTANQKEEKKNKSRPYWGVPDLTGALRSDWDLIACYLHEKFAIPNERASAIRFKTKQIIAEIPKEFIKKFKSEKAAIEAINAKTKTI